MGPVTGGRPSPARPGRPGGRPGTAPARGLPPSPRLRAARRPLLRLGPAPRGLPPPPGPLPRGLAVRRRARPDPGRRLEALQGGQEPLAPLPLRCAGGLRSAGRLGPALPGPPHRRDPARREAVRPLAPVLLREHGRAPPAASGPSTEPTCAGSPPRLRPERRRRRGRESAPCGREDGRPGSPAPARFAPPTDTRAPAPARRRRGGALPPVRRGARSAGPGLRGTSGTPAAGAGHGSGARSDGRRGRRRGAGNRGRSAGSEGPGGVRGASGRAGRGRAGPGGAPQPRGEQRPGTGRREDGGGGVRAGMGRPRGPLQGWARTRPGQRRPLRAAPGSRGTGAPRSRWDALPAPRPLAGPGLEDGPQPRGLPAAGPRTPLVPAAARGLTGGSPRSPLGAPGAPCPARGSSVRSLGGCEGARGSPSMMLCQAQPGLAGSRGMRVLWSCGTHAGRCWTSSSSAPPAGDAGIGAAWARR
ncbi:hypothetical protein LUU34_01431000 [Aix galericulata]|nr:hypothetical protein LUU34_01431000 [Aix galericulata]